MREVLKADIRPASELDLKKLRGTDRLAAPAS
jgi:hypothetical protein